MSGRGDETALERGVVGSVPGEDVTNMAGSGKVRELRQAASQSPAVRDVLERFVAAATRVEQRALLDELLVAWADTSGMAGTLEKWAA